MGTTCAARQRHRAAHQSTADVAARRAGRRGSRRAFQAVRAPCGANPSGIHPMTNILIVYGTTDGHTRKIVHVLAENLRALRCSVDVVDAAGTLRRLSPEGYDAVVVAASVHIGSFQAAVTRWVRTHADALNRLPTAFLSVAWRCLNNGPRRGGRSRPSCSASWTSADGGRQRTA